MSALHFGRFLLLSLISSVVHMNFLTPSNSSTSSIVSTHSAAILTIPTSTPTFLTVPSSAPTSLINPASANASVAPRIITKTYKQTEILIVTPLPKSTALPNPITPETQHSLFDTITLVVPMVFALQQSPLVRMVLLGMSSWEKLNRKLRAVKELQAMCVWLLRIGMAVLLAMYPVGGLRDVEEVWDGIVARKRRGGKGHGGSVGDEELQGMDGITVKLGKSADSVCKQPICQRRKKQAAGPSKLLLKRARNVEESFFPSPTGFGKKGGHRGRTIDIDLPIACPPTV